MSLTLEQILAANTLPRHVVPIPEWNGEVYVQTLDIATRSAIEDEFSGKKGIKSLSFRTRLLCATVVDETGKPLLQESHIPGLNSKAAERLFEAALEFNGFTKADAKILGHAEKN